MLPTPRFWIVQYMMASRSVRPLMPPKIGRTRLLPPPKPPRAEADQVVGENGKIFAPSRFISAAWMAARWAASSGRWSKPRAISSATGIGSGTSGWGTTYGVGRMQANRRVEIQELAKPAPRR